MVREHLHALWTLRIHWDLSPTGCSILVNILWSPEKNIHLCCCCTEHPTNKLIELSMSHFLPCFSLPLLTENWSLYHYLLQIWQHTYVTYHYCLSPLGPQQNSTHWAAWTTETYLPTILENAVSKMKEPRGRALRPPAWLSRKPSFHVSSLRQVFPVCVWKLWYFCIYLQEHQSY